MSTLGRTRIRLAGDAANFNGPLDVNSRATPQFWRGNDVQFEIAVFFNGVLQSVANLASVTLEIRTPGPAGGAPDPSSTPLMSATVDAGSLDNTLTSDTWADGSNQQALITFTSTQSNIAAGAQWLSLWVITTDSPGRVITLAAGPVRVLEDGSGLTTTPPTPDDTYYTAVQSDARYLAVDDPTDVAAARATLGLGTAATHDVPASGNASSSQVVFGNDTRLSDSRTPTTHASTHASGGSDALTLAESQVTNLVSDLAAKAPSASPTLTGIPTAPTPTTSDNSTTLATTAFVKTVAAAAIPESQITNLVSDLAAKAPLASPALTGTPTAPTPAAGDNSTNLATTAFLQMNTGADTLARLNDLLASRGWSMTNGGYLSLPISMIGSAFTFGRIALGALVKFRAAGVDEVLIQQWGSSGNYAFNFHRTSGNALELELSGDGSTVFKATATNQLLTSTTDWSHVCAVVDLIAGTATLYVNGVACTSNTTGTIPTSIYASSTATPTLGAATGGLDGWMAEATVYTRTLTATEVLDLSKGQAVGMSDRWGSTSAGYTSNFTAGNDGWSTGGGTQTSNATEPVGSTTGWDEIATTVTNGPFFYRNFSSLLRTTNGQRMRLTANVVVPTGVVNAYIALVGSNASPTAALLASSNEAIAATPAGANTFVELECQMVAGQTTIVLTTCTSAGNNVSSGAGNQTAYIKNVTVTQIGCLALFDDPQPSPGLVLDLSTNNLHALQSTTGTDIAKPPVRFKFVGTVNAGAFLGGSARSVLPPNYVITDIVADTVGSVTISVGQDATNNATRVASVALSAGRTALTLVATGRTLSSQQIYVAMTSGSSNTTITVSGFIAD
jgi:hypothetical protein